MCVCEGGLDILDTVLLRATLAALDGARDGRDRLAAPLGHLAVQGQLFVGAELVDVQGDLVPEQPRDFLEGEELGLGEELPHQAGPDQGQQDEQDVEAPADLDERDGSGLRVDERGGEQARHREPRALGAQGRREDLGAVDVARGVHGAPVEEDEEEQEEDAEPVADTVRGASERGDHGGEADERARTAGLGEVSGR